jgi:hypothetical protein
MDSRSASGGRVDVSAIGCGLEHGNLKRHQGGSSIASPIVAVSAWLKHLLDDTPSHEIRADLAFSSSLLPPRAESVASGGFFDPAKLLAGLNSHYVTVDGAVRPLLDPRLETDGCGDFAADPDNPGRITVVLFKEGSRIFMITRSPDDDFPFYDVSKPCEITTFKLFQRGATSDESVFDVDGASDIAGQLLSLAL